MKKTLNDSIQNEIISFLKKEKIPYKDLNLYFSAFTHMSYTHENFKNNISYERLEFLGDSVIGLIVSRYLYESRPDLDPGSMTLLKSHVVKKEYLSMIAKELNFSKLVKLGQGEDRTKISNSIYEDLLESFIGALYLDCGFEVVTKFLQKYILVKINKIKIENLKDYKTRLQEYLQSIHNKSAIYETKPKTLTFDSNQPVFQAKVVFDAKIYGIGVGRSKKDAEQNAAKNAYNKLVK